MQVVNLAHAQENPNLLITRQRPIKQKKREKKTHETTWRRQMN